MSSQSETPAIVVLEDHAGDEGPLVEKGALIECRFTGWLADGTVFDSSRERVYECVVGSKKLILGWSQGLMGMRAGGRRKFFVPSALAYGDRAIGAHIKPHADLTYEVEILSVRPRD